ncbi:L,D-transpeptidase [Prosthecobacter sp.]|uniref:L,D-transpeptidase n=1 Tax=Prosthecobacter sp. TaxID=1965333 RepID=UPI002ABADB7C|nr:L,D-transpeptidase [Prosthecobacter sp.]MDZ4401815.1 L,D-transpeptidase [Prosthecobacter sp.]
MSRRSLPLLSFLLVFMTMPVAFGATIDAITFNAEPGKLFLPVEEAVEELKWPLLRDDMGKVFQLNEMTLRAGSLRSLTDGTELVSTEQLAQAGASVSPLTEDGRVRVGGFFRGFTLVVSPQRVEVSLAKQQLQGWQGNRLVLQTRVSSGRNGRTPSGEFHAGPYRAQMHRSSLYDWAPMPWSVQINRHVFIHGFSSVPNYPASHGCIRVPLTEGNPAKFFYEWVLTGTPVSVKRD